MKQLLFLLCSLPCGFIMAQDCMHHALMQKGTQLEYKEYVKQPKVNIPVARLLFEVNQVKDSAGSTWSTITKRVFSNHDPKYHYERKIVLQCDGKNLLLPIDFYITDTIYKKDVAPHLRLDNYDYVFAYTPLEDAITYIVPLVIDCIVSLPEGKKNIRHLVKADFRDLICGKAKPYNGDSVIINSIKLESREMVTTPAGTFASYKFCMDVDQSRGFGFSNEKYRLYFNREAGMVKMEYLFRYVELIGTKK
jgi:hypothetical protein